MIEIRLYRNASGCISRFSASGHSGFAEYGRDIVCAAVSAVLQTAIMGLTELVGIEPHLQIAEGDLDCRLPLLREETAQKADIIVQAMVLGLKAIAAEYPAHVQVIEVQE